jgi:Xaa-Pro aminopeptidase
VSGFTGSDAIIVITRDEAHIFTDGRYEVQTAAECPAFITHIGARKLDMAARFLLRKKCETVGVESFRITLHALSELQKKAPAVRFIPAKERFLEALRIIKSPKETDLIVRAADIASKGCDYVVKKGLGGRTERLVAADMEYVFGTNGAERPSFDTIVASGARSALPHGKASEKVIEPGDLVVIDYGCVYQGYCSDETVTCVVGEPTSEQTRIHGVVRDAHDAAVDVLKPGVRSRDVDAAARRVIEKAGFGDRFTHGLGHGVGLEVHEAPSISPMAKGRLKEGMFFTIEPGIYIEGFGGVRLESLVYMTGSGPVIVSGMSKDLLTSH